VRNETSCDDFTDELAQVRGDDRHLVGQVLIDLFAEVGERNNLSGEGNDIVHIGFRDVLTHGHLGGINNALRQFLIVIDISG